MANGWITDREPIEKDVSEESNNCVEVTYRTGLIGWEFVHGTNWDEDNDIVAWRKIRPAYKANKVNKPTCEEIWNETGLKSVQDTVTHLEYVVFHSVVYQRTEDDSFWRVEYHESYDDVVNELRDGGARISRVIPEEVTETIYHPFCEYRHNDT